MLATSRVVLRLSQEQDAAAAPLAAAAVELFATPARAGFGEPSGPVGWKTLPSWALISPNDLAIGATGLRFMAERAGAVIAEVDASHVAMISQPQAATGLILSALGTIG